MASKTPIPVENPTLPFWLTDRSPLDQIRSTPELPQESDIVIIGAGYAGVSLAYHLLTSEAAKSSPPPSITILEARTVCSGATGRNVQHDARHVRITKQTGGHLRPDVYGEIPLYIQRHGLELATEVAEFELSHVKAIQAVLKKEQIEDCDLVITRNMNVYLHAERGKRVKDAIDKLRDQGCTFVDDIFHAPDKDAEAISGVKGAKTAFSFTSGSLWPYKFILGLLRKVLEYGGDKINVQTTTPVTSVSSSSATSHTITTPRGTIKAKQVVYTTNAYTSGILPEYAPAIIPARGIVSHIDVPDAQKPPPHLSYTYVVCPHESTGVDYMIVRPDGSIVVGGAHQIHANPSRKPEDNTEWYRNSDDSTLIESTKGYFEGYMQKYFRGWEDSGAHVKELWTGIMGYSSDSAPHVGQVPSRPGQYISAGFTGHGMPVIFLTTKGLAEMILAEKKFEETAVALIVPFLLALKQSVACFAVYVFSVDDRQACRRMGIVVVMAVRVLFHVVGLLGLGDGRTPETVFDGLACPSNKSSYAGAASCETGDLVPMGGFVEVDVVVVRQISPYLCFSHSQSYVSLNAYPNATSTASFFEPGASFSLRSKQTVSEDASATIPPPNFNEHDLSSRTPLSGLALLLQETSHNRWGFPIFRTTYANNDLFTAYLSEIYRSANESLENIGRREALSPYFSCPVIEHPLSLNGLSKTQIRERFSAWVRDTTDQRDGVGAVKMRELKAPQYEFCLMVDEECLVSFWQAQQQPHGGWKGNGKVVVIERDWSPEKYRGQQNEDWTDGESHRIFDKEYLEENGEEYERDVPPTPFEEIDGCRSPLVGWMYADIHHLKSLYCECLENSYRENWYESYVRPPGIYPTLYRHEQPWKYSI
ncbi:hypothetical protein UA08_01860 [Talaromyces atroroseus]|uniref:FAD dependent oxidoreductase domain-containing protein n=1 Tax=Talaromyces atroroseus TaxID=1441469 RepID=A0A1Q5QBH8_TALAT|nr:hypothetical protein UA08_01860 [Talaromyces atroroseus]OKL63284.1 hypothetical protein UA08_01860 [Talaromyces atroroseus]